MPDDRQREHQANERTFLAWLRTAIALIGFGFAIARFGLFLRELRLAVTQAPPLPTSVINAQSLGIGLVVVGIIVIALSVWRYNVAFWQIEQYAYRPSRWMVWLTAAIVAVLGLLSIPYVLFSPAVNGDPLEPQSQVSAPLRRWVRATLPHRWD